MVRKCPYEQQTSRDVHRAQCLVSRVRGLDPEQSAEELRRRASRSGISLHAAALAVLSTSPTDELLLPAMREPR